MIEKVTWRELISRECKRHNDVQIVGWATEGALNLDAEFRNDFGNDSGASFTMWTLTRVYFPVIYDGMVSVKSVPRNPCVEVTAPIGGH
jgi:hypothetical protein